MIPLVDYSVARPLPSAIKDTGARGCLRYVCSVLLCPGKGITVAEARAILAALLEYGLVYEDGANDFAGGAAVGRSKAAIALTTIHALLAADLWSLTRPIYCAVDENLPESLYASTAAGILAFAQALQCPPGCYGPRPFLRYLEQQHGVVWLWELGSSSFNTGLEPPANKRLQQLVEIPAGCKAIDGVDWDEALTSDWGQFPAPVPPKPTPNPEDDVTPHSETIEIGANGQGTLKTSFAGGKVVSVLPEFGEGPKPAGSVGIVPGSNPVVLSAKGWPEGPLVVIVGIVA